jgi:hypothetical protein
MRHDRILVWVAAVALLAPLCGCVRQPVARDEPPAPTVGQLWSPSDPHAAARAALGRAYGLFPPIVVSGTTDQEIPLPSWITSAVVESEYDGPVSGRGFIVTTLEEDNMPTDGTLAASLDRHYRGIAAFGVDTEYAGDPAKILVQDWGGGRWTVTISPVALAPVFRVPGAEGTFWSSVFLYDGPAVRWTFTKEAGVGPGQFRVMEFTADRQRHELIDQLMHPTIRATVTAEPGPALVIVDSDGRWRVTD